MSFLFDEKKQRMVLAYVCPICYKMCPLIKRLSRLCFEPEELRRTIKQHHRDVCPICKKIKCKPDLCKPKLLKKSQALPPWWE